MDLEDLRQAVPYERPGSPPRRQRACLPCSKAKARCNFREENIGRYCDRCKRLNVECSPQTTKSLRRPRQLKPFTSRVASLEQKIDGIATLLATGQQQLSPSASPIPSGSQISFDGTQSSFPTTDSISQESHYGLPQETQPLSHAIPPCYGPPAPDVTHHASTPPTPGYNLSWEQAELAVGEYKVNYMPNFPFVVIEPEVTAQELFHEKPFLFRVVLLVATRIPLEKKQTMKRNVTAYLGQHLLVNEERSLDLLQGLLVFIAWGDLSFYLDRQITHLIHLAIGYAHNLGLTRVPTEFMEESHSGTSTSSSRGGGGLQAYDAEEAMYLRNPRALAALEKIHNLEEQRTYLGCYYLMSVNSAQFARRNSFSSHYVNMCCQCLLQATEVGSDFILEKMVRLQQFVDRISEQSPVVKEGISKTSRFAYLIPEEMTPLRAELDKLTADIHVNPHFTTFWLHYYYLLVRLYEPAIHLSDPPPTQGSFYRSQCLLFCLQAGKSYFNNLLALPIEGLAFRSFVSGAELLAVIIVMSRLLLLEIDNWDLTLARQTLDFAAVCQSLIEQFQLASALLVDRIAPPSLEDDGSGGDMPSNGKDSFLKYADKLRFIRSWYIARASGEASLTTTEIDQALFPPDWSVLTNLDSQFWLGLLPLDNWGIDFSA